MLKLDLKEMKEILMLLEQKLVYTTAINTFIMNSYQQKDFNLQSNTH